MSGMVMFLAVLILFTLFCLISFGNIFGDTFFAGKWKTLKWKGITTKARGFQFSLRRMFVITSIICVYIALMMLLFNLFITSPVWFAFPWLLVWIHVLLIAVAVKADDKLLIRLLLILVVVFWFVLSFGGFFLDLLSVEL